MDKINIRKSIIHAINKQKIVQDDLASIPSIIDNVFPLITPLRIRLSILLHDGIMTSKKLFC